MTIFREIGDADVEQIVALWRTCGLTREWNDPHKDIAFARLGGTSTILVAEASGRIIASVMAGHDGHRGVLYYVAVDPAFQRRGLGTEAVRAAEFWLRAHGVWKINLLIRNENEMVRGFYENLGYEVSPVLGMGKWIDRE